MLPRISQLREMKPGVRHPMRGASAYGWRHRSLRGEGPVVTAASRSTDTGTASPLLLICQEDRHVPDVYLLGAGFSHAVSTHMPLLAGLGAEVTARLDPAVLPRGLRLAPADFESWLSYLAGDQPWLDEPTRLDNRAAFLRVSYVLHDVVREREHLARAAPLPDWLASLVARWHQDRATVLTLNYDMLVEAAYTEVVSVRFRVDDGSNYVYHQQVQRSAISPVGSRTGAVLGSTPVDTFTLVKLHGSRSWVYSGRPTYYGETIYDTYHGQGWAPVDDDPEPSLSEDKVPLIVPPTAGKTGLFDNETVRAEWRRAHLALADATRVFVVGYSLPPSDLIVGLLLQQSCPPDAEVTVVDPNLEVRDRLRRLLQAAGSRSDVRSLESVQALSDALPPEDRRPTVIFSP